MDSNRQPDRTNPQWSETRWNGCFDPGSGAGLFLHAGRLQSNIDWWWAQTAVYLPSGQLVVDRSWVRDPDPSGIRTPTLDLRIENPGWSARFDGIAQLVTTEQLASAPCGSGSPSVPVRFEVSSDGSRPLWDMGAHDAGEQDFAGDMHIEQAGRSTGELTIDDVTYRLDGVSYHDHSCGVRDLTAIGSHHFAMVVMPDLTIHEIGIRGRDDTAQAPVGAWMDGNAPPVGLARAEMPHLEDLLGNPKRYEMVLQPHGADAQTFQVEILNAFPATILENNDNINGIDWEAAGDPMFVVECQGRITAPDGTIGHAHIERSSRRSEMQAKSARATR